METCPEKKKQWPMENVAEGWGGSSQPGKELELTKDIGGTIEGI